uniref:Uncharacterized protein n=1 Tax=Peronospora matthiolae TaxID=2874970 RepID=A0AAV1TTE4_9STRA
MREDPTTTVDLVKLSDKARQPGAKYGHKLLLWEDEAQHLTGRVEKLCGRETVDKLCGRETVEKLCGRETADTACSLQNS